MLVLDRQWKRDVTSLRWFFFIAQLTPTLSNYSKWREMNRAYVSITGKKNPHKLIRPEVREPGTLDEFISVLPQAAAKKQTKNENKTNPEK